MVKNGSVFRFSEFCWAYHGLQIFMQREWTAVWECTLISWCSKVWTGHIGILVLVAVV